MVQTFLCFVQRHKEVSWSICVFLGNLYDWCLFPNSIFQIYFCGSVKKETIQVLDGNAKFQLSKENRILILCDKDAIPNDTEYLSDFERNMIKNNCCRIENIIHQKKSVQRVFFPSNIWCCWYDCCNKQRGIHRIFAIHFRNIWCNSLELWQHDK